MYRSLTFVTLALVSGLLSAACGDRGQPTPPAPPPVSISEAFSGTLTRNGARTHPFNATRGGTITANLSALGPDSDAVVGLALGTWNGVACALTITIDDATQGTTVVGQANTPGAFCVRLSDSQGTLPQPLDYEIVVTYFVAAPE